MTICSNCRHFRWEPRYGQLEPKYAATRVNFVTDGVFSLQLCRKVNTDGNCQKYVAIADEVEPISVKPWWKFWAR